MSSQRKRPSNWGSPWKINWVQTIFSWVSIWKRWVYIIFGRKGKRPKEYPKPTTLSIFWILFSTRRRQKPLHIDIVRRNQTLQIGPQCGKEGLTTPDAQVFYCCVRLAASIREREMTCPITISGLPIYCFLCCRRRRRTIDFT